MAHDSGIKTIKIPGRNIKARDVTFKPDGHLVIADDSGNIREWDLDTVQDVSQSTMKASHTVNIVVASMDGRWIVSGDSGNKVIVWNAVTHKVAIEISEHSDGVFALDVSNDSTRIASGSDDRTVQIFDVISGSRVIPPLQHDDFLAGVKFSPDGDRIAAAGMPSGAHVYVYCTQSGNRLFDVPVTALSTPSPLTWSSNGRRLYVASKGKITSFDTSTSSRSEWPIQNGNTTVSIVDQGQFIACSAGTSVSFWDSASCKQIGSIIDHAAVVNCISISHDGRYLACGHNSEITVHNLHGVLPQHYFNIPLAYRIPLMQVSEAVFESWKLDNAMDTESILSDEIRKGSDPNHHMLATRSFMRAHQKEWKGAIEDAEMSLQIKQSPIGQIAMSFALAGSGKQEVALDDFDFVFRSSDPSDTVVLLVIKSVLLFACGKYELAVSRLHRLIASADEKTTGYCIQVLGKIYLEQKDYENAVQILESAKYYSDSKDHNPLMTISLISGWNFDCLRTVAWQRLCETLYASGRIKELDEALLKMVSPLAEDERERAHGRILEYIVTHSGQVALLSWIGKPSTCNSCLPSSPTAYSQSLFVSPLLGQDDLRKRVNELRAVFPLTEALVIYGCLIHLQPVRFTHFRLLLPCIVFGITSLRQEQEHVYRAETIGLGDVEITTADSLPLKEPRRLVLVDTRIHGLNRSYGTATLEDRLDSDAVSNASWDNAGAGADAELVHASMIEEVPSTPSDAYTRALELIAQLGQPFSALLLMRQSDGAYKRVATDREIIVGGMGNNFLQDIRVEVLEIL